MTSFSKFSIVSALFLMLSNPNATNAQAVPVRNDVPRVGQQEVIIMRHAYLQEGQYDYWKQESVSGVWPWFGRLGARIVGDFEVIYPQGDDESPGEDEALRLPAMPATSIGKRLVVLRRTTRRVESSCLREAAA